MVRAAGIDDPAALQDCYPPGNPVRTAPQPDRRSEEVRAYCTRGSKPAFHIPHARNKNKDDLHVVPLPNIAKTLFIEALKISNKTDFIFPSEVNPDAPLHADTLTAEIAFARKELKIAPAEDGEEAALHGQVYFVSFASERPAAGTESERRFSRLHQNPSAGYVELCRKLGLLTKASVAIDGNKCKAVNNRDKNFTRKVERRRKQLEESVACNLTQLDSADRKEPSRRWRLRPCTSKRRSRKSRRKWQSWRP
ncbi:MAG: hypothetical protein WBX25_29770 [Rhodomicrobium sp.]